jgi:Spy/CpxP family protein refolding chaperone
MKSFPRIVVLGLVLACAGGPVEAQKEPDPLAEHFYPPELVRMAHQALKLTEDQQAALQEAAERVQSRTAAFQERMKGARAKLEGLVEQTKLDEEAVLEQASKVMNLERDIKMAQLVLLVKIKNTLTAEQRTKLDELKGKSAGFQAKVRQAMELAKKWKEEGRDISSFQQAREEFESLMKDGDFKAAEQLLEKTLKRLQEGKK